MQAKSRIVRLGCTVSNTHTVIDKYPHLKMHMALKTLSGPLGHRPASLLVLDLKHRGQMRVASIIGVFVPADFFSTHVVRSTLGTPHSPIVCTIRLSGKKLWMKVTLI